MANICSAQDFEIQFLRRRAEFINLASSLEEYIAFTLSEERVLFHDVAFRVKTAESAHRKILSKKYNNPWDQLMGLIAGRIFTYFKDDAILVEEVVRKHFDIDDAHSINRAETLAHNEFGYTSRHLICNASSKTQDLKLRSSLMNMKFEIQIRSVLEHGWAEVEPELVYKARTKTPDSIRRRFAASAASLELIELEFSRLRAFEPEIIKQRTSLVGSSSDEQLDRAWMIAALCCHFPDRATWSPNPREDNFYRGHEISILNFLTSHGSVTVGRWDSVLTSQLLDLRINEYAKVKEIGTEMVNHLPIAVVACASVGDILSHPDFDDIIDEGIQQVIKLSSENQ